MPDMPSRRRFKRICAVSTVGEHIFNEILFRPVSGRVEVL